MEAWYGNRQDHHHLPDRSGQKLAGQVAIATAIWNCARRRTSGTGGRRLAVVRRRAPSHSPAPCAVYRSLASIPRRNDGSIRSCSRVGLGGVTGRSRLHNAQHREYCAPTAGCHRCAEEVVDLAKIGDCLHVPTVDAKQKAITRSDNSYKPLPAFRELRSEARLETTPTLPHSPDILLSYFLGFELNPAPTRLQPLYHL